MFNYVQVKIKINNPKTFLWGLLAQAKIWYVSFGKVKKLIGLG